MSRKEQHGSPSQPPDFIDSPDEPMFAKMYAFVGRANESRRIRARIRARASLRGQLGREPLPAEVEVYAQALYARNDAALVVSKAELLAELDPGGEKLTGGGVSALHRPSGPAPITSLEEVEKTRAQLKKDGRPSGERSIASALGVSRDAVRYALGKDRR